ncbi:MAG TPA: hypothetical protein VK835_03150, partial [Bacteroidia bacterium]|nr:hypothetical protein [Bacteroidia bacterium]
YAISPKIYFVGEAFTAPNIAIANVTSAAGVTQVGFYSLSPAIRTNISHNISWVVGVNGLFYTYTTKNGTSSSGFALPYAGFSFKL